MDVLRLARKRAAKRVVLAVPVSGGWGSIHLLGEREQVVGYSEHEPDYTLRLVRVIFNTMSRSEHPMLNERRAQRAVLQAGLAHRCGCADVVVATDVTDAELRLTLQFGAPLPEAH
ncbi:MAG: hypothetical protein EPN79_15905 [Burkholderiaceae bacterium]|nr:MAG: hypothetical protein EPN79_15905 [Burkholderiaceae bacterium]